MQHNATRWDVMRHNATDDAALPVTRHYVMRQDATRHDAMQWDAMQRNATDNAAIPIDRTSLPVVSTINTKKEMESNSLLENKSKKNNTPDRGQR